MNPLNHMGRSSPQQPSIFIAAAGGGRGAMGGAGGAAAAGAADDAAGGFALSTSSAVRCERGRVSCSICDIDVDVF